MEFDKCTKTDCEKFDSSVENHCRIEKDVKDCDTYLRAKLDAVADVPCNDGLCANLSLMLDVFNSCIETRVLPGIGSPCQKRILKLLKKSGRKPSASK